MTTPSLRADAAWQEALALLREMPEKGDAAPTLITYNIAISVCERAGRAAEAAALLAEMRARGVAPDVVSYSSAISSCNVARRPDDALRLLRNMRDAGLAPREPAYGAVIDCLSAAGRLEARL